LDSVQAYTKNVFARFRSARLRLRYPLQAAIEEGEQSKPANGAAGAGLGCARLTPGTAFAKLKLAANLAN